MVHQIDITALGTEGQRHAYAFRKHLPSQVLLHEVSRALLAVEGKDCLDLGMPNAMVSYHLRRFGGTWETVAVDEETAEAARQIVGGEIPVWNGERLPFENKQFDVLVVNGVMETVADDGAFVEECHRVLKPDGRLILGVPHAVRSPVVRGLRSLLGVGYERFRLARAGYTESALFNILKHGFDVHQVRSYSRVCVQVTAAVTDALLSRSVDSLDPEASRRRIYAVSDVFFRIAYQLDLLLFFLRGHRLIAVSKRRAWLPRKTPVLVDGRSISEAVLSRAAR